MKGGVTSSGGELKLKFFPSSCCHMLIVSVLPAARFWPPPQRLESEQPPPAQFAVASSGVSETSSHA